MMDKNVYFINGMIAARAIGAIACNALTGETEPDCFRKDEKS
jgi:hypothetical protein